MELFKHINKQNNSPSILTHHHLTAQPNYNQTKSTSAYINAKYYIFDPVHKPIVHNSYKTEPDELSYHMSLLFFNPTF